MVQKKEKGLLVANGIEGRPTVIGTSATGTNIEVFGTNQNWKVYDDKEITIATEIKSSIFDKQFSASNDWSWAEVDDKTVMLFTMGTETHTAETYKFTLGSTAKESKIEKLDEPTMIMQKEAKKRQNIPKSPHFSSAGRTNTIAHHRTHNCKTQKQHGMKIEPNFRSFNFCRPSF